MPISKLWKRITNKVSINDYEDEDEIIPPSPQRTKKRNSPHQLEPHETSGEENVPLRGSRPSCHFFMQKWMLILYVILLCLFLGALLPYLLINFSFEINLEDEIINRTCLLNSSYRFPCAKGSLTEKECENLECCFDTFYSLNPYAPNCFHSLPSFYNFQIDEQASTQKATQLELSVGSTLEKSLIFTSRTNSFGGNQLKAIFRAERCTPSVIWITFRSSDHTLDKDYCTKFLDVDDGFPDGQIDLALSEGLNQLNITVYRQEGNKNVTLIQTVFGPIEFGATLNSITTTFSTTRVFGFGQTNNYELAPTFSKWSTWDIFLKESTENLTGVATAHPFAMAIEPNGKSHGVYFKNGGVQQIELNDIPGVAVRGIGGLIDLTVFGGPRPTDVSRQFTLSVGRPYMPPYWGLGYHLCRTSASEGQRDLYDEVKDKIKAQNVPYESDCINARLNYPNSWVKPEDELWVNNAANELTAEGRKFIQVNYPFQSPSNHFNHLVQLPGKQKYFGAINDEAVVYPNYLNDGLNIDDPNFQDIFTRADGFLLLKNSPLNEAVIDYTATEEVGTSVCSEANPELCCRLLKPEEREGLSETISDGTICWETIHSSDVMGDIAHVDVHNSYGFHHTKTVSKMLENDANKKDKRKFIISGSSSSETGSLAGSMEEGYGPDFTYQQKSLVKTLEKGLYGVPFSAHPLCGSIDSATFKENPEQLNELCLRAFQVGSFYPIMMSHYEIKGTPRDPVDFSEQFVEKLKVYIKQRYMLLPYLYTLFKEAVQTGTPVVTPLFYHYSTDPGSLNIIHQFMVGSSLMVSPVFKPMVDTSILVQTYFPPGCWYEFYSGAEVIRNIEKGEFLNISTSLHQVNAFLTGGSIVPLQGDLHRDFYSSKDFKLKPHHLYVALPCSDDEEGWGELYQDDGETLFDGSNPPASHNHIIFQSTNSSLTLTAKTKNYCGTGLISTEVESIFLYGIFSYERVQATTNSGGKLVRGTYSADIGTLKITFTGSDFDWCGVDDFLKITWS